MSLIKRNQPQQPKIQQSASTERKIESAEKITLSNISKPKKKPVGSQNRKNIKVSPETFSLIKNICTLRSLKNYELVDELLENFIKNELTEREQKLLQTLNTKDNK